MATELTGTIDTLESDQRATPIGMERAEGPFEANVDQDFLALEDVELLLEEYLSLAGGSFPVEEDVDFGASNGLLVRHLWDRVTTPPEGPGVFIGIGFNKGIWWANSDQEYEYKLDVNAGVLEFEGQPITVGGLIAANNLSDLANVSTARGNLGLGTAAVLDEGVAAGNLTTNTTVDGSISNAISALSTVYQPLDATLTTISGNGTTGTNTSAVVLADAPTFTTGITTPAVTGGTTLTLGSTGANPVIVNVGGSEAARFAATTRNLLINTTTDDGVNKLQVNGTIYASSTVLSNASGVSTDSFKATKGTTERLIMRLGNTGGDAIFGIDDNAGGTTIVGASAYDTIVRGASGIAFSANAGAALQMRITSAGVLDVPIGQIKFPATQNPSSDANTLDDYETGTWTPVDASGAGLSLTVSNATFTKIGRLCTVMAYLQYPTTADGSNAFIGGLPFTSRSNSRSGSALWTNVGASVYGFVEASTTTIGLRDDTFGSKTNAQMTDKFVCFTFSYTTA